MQGNSTFHDAVDYTWERRSDFFKLLFYGNEGYVCIATKAHNNNKMYHQFFYFPTEFDKMLRQVEVEAKAMVHVYFCPNLMRDKNFSNSNVKYCTTAWADLDSCPPSNLLVKPSISVITSKGRFQALWRLDRPVAPEIAEDISRRIAYHHKDQGADVSGWDLAQLLRVPYTPNYKYEDNPMVAVDYTNKSLYRPSDFDIYEQVEALAKITTAPMPEILDLPQDDPLDILERYRRVLNPQAFDLYSSLPEPDEDWSTRLWKLEKLCFEAGITPEETFVICRGSSCNKYKRDGRAESELWAEVLRAYIQITVEDKNLITSPTAKIPELLSKEETDIVLGRKTFVERYIEWASEATDGAPQYHQAGAFTILSALLSANITLDTSFGKISPNMWFLILANTTLTRKSVSMSIAMKLLNEIDDSLYLASDGSMEGLLSALKERPGKSSLFHRDEFTGLLDSMTHKDYMAGFAEQLTQLYDGNSIKRLLRKEEIKIDNPIFQILAGGILSRTIQLLSEEHINSGFLPRFVFITAVADPSRIRPIGPPGVENLEHRELIKNELLDLYNHYTKARPAILNGKQIGEMRPDFAVTLTTAAWLRYNEFEKLLTDTALASGLDHLTPMYDRLAKSALKAAILISAARQREMHVEVTVEDILHAIYYCRLWYGYTNEVISEVGKSTEERIIGRVLSFLKMRLDGASRAEIMDHFKMNVKTADLIFTTMLQRNLMYQVSYGRGLRYIGVK